MVIFCLFCGKYKNIICASLIIRCYYFLKIFSYPTTFYRREEEVRSWEQPSTFESFQGLERKVCGIYFPQKSPLTTRLNAAPIPARTAEVSLESFGVCLWI